MLAVNGFTSLLLRQVPETLRGRVMALWTAAFLGNRPIAAVLDGTAADLVGPRWAMGLAMSVALLGYGLTRRLSDLLGDEATELAAEDGAAAG